VAHRVVVTSTDDNSLTFQVVNDSFANQFMHILESGGSVFEAFRIAENMILSEDKYFIGQRPWIDDDGDGQFLNDGERSADIYVGNRIVSQAPAPRIKVHPHLTLTENDTTATLWVRTTPSGTESIHKVRAVLIQPHYELNEYQGEDTDFNRLELDLIYNPAQDRYEVVYDGFCANAGLWQILYQAQDIDGVWSEIMQGEVQAPNCLPISTKMLLNQSRYTTGNPLHLDMEVNGNATVDLYVAIIFPDGTFITITYPFEISWPNTIQVYQPNVEIAGQKTNTIMDFPLPADIAKGQYQAYGALVSAGADPHDQSNWIHFNGAVFEVY